MLRVPTSAAHAFYALARWAISAGGKSRQLGEAVLQELHPTPKDEVLPGQLTLWIVDEQGLPERPWRIPPEFRLHCRALACDLTAGECVRRQRETDGKGTADTWRGQAAVYPTCRTETCGQGRGVRAALADMEPARLRQAGLAPRMRSGGVALAEQRARVALERVGLLDEVKDIDSAGAEEA